MHYERCQKTSPATFTIIELLVVIGIIALLMSLILPIGGRIRDRAQTIRCANQLREISAAMTLYSMNEPDRTFPRAPYDPSKPKLQLDNAGFMVADTFGKSGYVSENNVPAIMFLLFKTMKLSPSLFLCPSTTGVPWDMKVDPRRSSNWEHIPDGCTYSFAAPYPTPAARNSFVWHNILPAEFAVMADMNPGTRGGSDPLNNVIGPAHTDGNVALRAANSNNHNNRGQNVIYGDGHVEFQTTPYCGWLRKNGIYDHIYAAGTGDRGVCSELAIPVDKFDSVMMPTDDPGGR